MFSARLDVGEIVQAVASLEASLDEEMHDAVDDCDKIVATEAARQHAYTNRTGMLEHMTLPGRTEGSFINGRVTGYVTGDTEYGEYVENLHDRKYSYLAPANRRTDGQQSRTLDQRLRRAVARSKGWA